MAKFPQPPDQSGYAVTRGSTVALVELDGGAPRVRKTQLGAWARVPVQWTCDKAGFEAIQAFYDTTLVEGSLQFTIDLYMKLGVLTEHKAIIVPGTFKLVSQTGLTWVVGAELLANPTPVTP